MSHPCAHCASDGRDVREQCWACGGSGRTATDLSQYELCEDCNEPTLERELDDNSRCEKCAQAHAVIEADRAYERMMEEHPCDGLPRPRGESDG